MAPAHRLDRWRSTYEAFNALTPLGPISRDFEASNEIWSFCGLALLRNSAPAMGFERLRRHIQRDSIDHWVVRVVRRGQMTLRIGDKVLRASPGRPLLFGLGQPHDGERSDTDWVSLYIPRDTHPDLAAGLDRLGNCTLDHAGAGLLADVILLLERRMAEATLAELPALAEGARAMVAACLLRGAGAAAQGPDAAAFTQLEQVRRVIRQNIGSAMLGPERLCRAAGLSRSQLYRLFEPHGGVARYIQIQRMRLARVMLEDAACTANVSAIAERVGHFNASAFSRAFRQEFGVTPVEVRAAARAGLRLPLGTTATATFNSTDFVGVLRTIGVAPEPLRPAA
ncbi:helix-turn-helix domain-containing protein [Roseicella frigidaeris]|uniref:helix-turn-helix domain-containing protein n=1 Tax=Roseicella frigidaeris TaxID=2230885 RepID=UPI001404064E|nr:helix-turn-helix domain-containing protein [Roseicella frigidaeris]